MKPRATPGARVRTSALTRYLATMLVALGSGTVALAKEPVPAYWQAIVEMEPSSPITSLEDWDTLVGFLTMASQTMHESANLTGSVAGHPLDYYYDQYVLQPEPKAKLEALRNAARQSRDAGDESGVKAALAQAEPLLQAEKYKAAVVPELSGYAALFAYHRGLLAPWLMRAAPSERASADATVQSAYSALVKALDSAVRAPNYDAKARGRLNELASEAALEALNAQRLRLIAEQAELELPNPVPVDALVRTTACPPAVPPSPDRQRPGLGSDFPASEEFYPATPKSQRVTGPVTVSLLVSDTGCPVRAEVDRSSGDPALDLGALELAMAGHYVPGSKDGRAVPGELRFKVKFEFKD